MINFEEHFGLVHHVYNKYYRSVAERIQMEEDYIQEGKIALYKASQDFDESKDVLFATFAFHQIHGAMSNFNRNMTGRSENKQKFINNLVSINNLVNSTNMEYSDTIKDEKISYRDSITKMDFEEALKDIPTIAQQILSYIVDGYTYKEIGKMFNMTTQGVYYYKRQYSKLIKQNVLAIY